MWYRPPELMVSWKNCFYLFQSKVCSRRGLNIIETVDDVKMQKKVEHEKKPQLSINNKYVYNKYKNHIKLDQS